GPLLRGGPDTVFSGSCRGYRWNTRLPYNHHPIRHRRGVTHTLMSSRKSTFIRFLGYVRPYWKQIVAASIGGIVKFTLPLYVPQVTRHLFDDVYLNPALSPAAKEHELYVAVGTLVLVFIFFWAPWVYVRHYYAGRAGYRSVFDLRYDLYYRILRMSA